MTAFLTAFLMVFLAELGDKTQLLVMAFAAKYRWQTVMLAVLIQSSRRHYHRYLCQYGNQHGLHSFSSSGNLLYFRYRHAHQ